jgi:linoleate 10R-lipoxygenase
MKRFTSVFKKEKKPESNGINGSNGRTKDPNPIGQNGTSSGVEDPAAGTSTDGPDHSVNRDGMIASFEKFAQVIHAADRPLPSGMGDGSYIDDPKQGGLLGDLKAIRVKDLETADNLLKQELSGTQLTDDKTMIMERTIQARILLCTQRSHVNPIQLVSNLPANSKNRVKLTNTFVGTLWDSLGHPPQSVLGDKYNYRQADGSLVFFNSNGEVLLLTASDITTSNSPMSARLERRTLVAFLRC